MELGVQGTQLTDLYYTLLLKDSGGSNKVGRRFRCHLMGVTTAKVCLRLERSPNSAILSTLAPKTAKAQSRLKNRLGCFAGQGRQWDSSASDIAHARSERGARISAELGFDQQVADGVYSVAENWNGTGRPQGLAADKIPLASRLTHLAQMVDLFHSKLGREAALGEVLARNGTTLDPQVVAAFEQVAQQEAFWQVLESEQLEDQVVALEPGLVQVELTDERLDSIAVSFAKIIDAKSHFTSGHSERVAETAAQIGEKLGLSDSRLKWIWRGALLHDIVKLGVSSYIWDKPGKLNADEWRQIRQHPTFTKDLLSRINPFRSMATIAANHHEKLDGSGYPMALTAENIALESRILTISDIYDALIVDRSYRDGLPRAEALEILSRMASEGEVDPACLEALLACIADEERQANVA